MELWSTAARRGRPAPDRTGGEGAMTARAVARPATPATTLPDAGPHRELGSAPGSQAVDRAAALLAAIVESPRPRSFTSLVDELGLAKSTTSRLLQALERNRLVHRDRAGCFRPGALFSSYAAREQTVRDLVELARPMLERLAEETGETINFSIPRGDGIIQVAQLDSRYLLGATNWVGVEVPPHCSALGKVFYAFGRLRLPTGPLERRTAATISSVERLERELVEVRRRGWAVAWEELEVGLVAIAAPIRTADGVVGAVSVSAPTARLPRSRVPAVAALLTAQAGEISTQLGYPGTGRPGREGTA
jgi:IclR family acetate operon transcriptional repressor